MSERILVTGGLGYLGSILCEHLLDAGYRVTALDNLMYGTGQQGLYHLCANPDFDFVKGDVRDAADVNAAVEGCHAIAHLAAIVGDPACKKEPDLARSTNLDGGKLLWEAANAAGCKRFVFASTCSNYGKMENAESFERLPLELAFGRSSPLQDHRSITVGCADGFDFPVGCRQGRDGGDCCIEEATRSPRARPSASPAPRL